MNGMKFNLVLLALVSTLVLSNVAFAVIASNPYAHYDAADVASITLGNVALFPNDPNTGVSQWDDQTANGFDAVSIDNGNANGGGTTFGGDFAASYPGSTFSSGIKGIEFGDSGGNGTALDMLAVGAEQDNLLDFDPNGGASGNSGFSIYMVYHNDTNFGSPFGGNPDFQYLLGNADFPNNAGPGIWSNANGFIFADINAAAGGVFAGFIPAGEESIISLNYNATSGNFTIANQNKLGAGSGSGVGNSPAGNFSGVEDLAIGSSPVWANFRSDGDFGEVILYDRFIDPTGSEHSDTISALNTKWLVPEPTGLVLAGLVLAGGCLGTRRRRS